MIRLAGLPKPLPAGGPEGDLFAILESKFISIAREGQTVNDAVTRTVKAILTDVRKIFFKKRNGLNLLD